MGIQHQDLEKKQVEIQHGTVSREQQQNRILQNPVEQQPQQQQLSKTAYFYNTLFDEQFSAALLDLEVRLKMQKGDDEPSFSRQELTDAFYGFREKLAEGREIPVSELTASALRLQEAANAYLTTHSGQRKTEIGEARQILAGDVKRLTGSLFRKLETGVKKDGGGLGGGAGNLVPVSKKDAERAEKKVLELAKHYVRWTKIIDSSASIDSPEEKLRKRYKICRVYEKDIRDYQDAMEGKVLPKDIHALLTEIDLITRTARVLRWAREEDGKPKFAKGEATLAVERHVEEIEEEKGVIRLDEDEVDYGLRDDQIAGIAAIDQWFVRNFNNGGVISAFNKTNRNDEAVAALLSMSKRERLHIYYLIEKDARKRSSHLDAAASQVYTPDLEAFKSKMLATKFKFITRISGGYTYMNKLTDALQVAKDYKNEVRISGLLEKKDALKEEVTEPRMIMMRELYGELRKYMDLLETAKKSKGEQKKTAERNAKAVAAQAQNMLKELIRLDQSFEHKTGGAEGKDAERVKDVASYTRYYLTGASKVDKLGKLGLDKLDGFKFWSGTASASLAAAGQAAAGVLAVMNLITTGSTMSASEMTTAIGEVLKSASSVTAKALKGLETAQKLVSATGEAAGAVSKGLTYAGAGAAGLSLAINGFQGINAMYHVGQANKAGKYFEQKRAERERTKTEENKKLDRKEKYEKNMVALSKSIAKKTMVTAGIKSFASSASMVGVFFPGLGTVVALVGCAITLGAVLADVWMRGKLQKAMFDRYYNIADLQERLLAMNPSWKKKDQKALRKNIRLRVAIADNCASVKTACNKVAKKYAAQVRSVLFDPEAPKQEKDAYIHLVNSFGLSFKEEKGEPDDENGIEILTVYFDELGINEDEAAGEFFFRPLVTDEDVVQHFTGIITIAEDLPLEHLPELFRAITYINFSLPCGSFCIDQDHTYLSFRLTAPLPIDLPEDLLYREMNIVCANAAQIVDVYIDLLNRLIEGELTLDELLEEI